MKAMIALSLTALMLSGCATTKVSWDTLEENIGDDQYCQKAFSDEEDMEKCSIEMAARKRAKKLCAQAKYVEQCEVNAAYSWDSFKFVMSNKFDAKPTMTAAEKYPVMCNYGRGIKKPCEETVESN